jgi:di-N-acetylchitobiase
MSYSERGQIFGPCIAWANSPVNVTLAGLTSFLQLKIPPSKIVLGVPWYGYDYPCISYDFTNNICTIPSVPYRGVNCSDAAGQELGYSYMMTMLNQSFTGQLWDSVAMSPYASYKDEKTGEVHQIWFDNVPSLSIKFSVAHHLGLLGVGMWEADSLDYADTPVKREYVREMWNALPNRRR